MRSKLALISSLLIPLLLSSLAISRPVDNQEQFTLQVAAFPDAAQAEKFIAKLAGAGEHPIWGTVDIPGRGKWIRVFIGSFENISAARHHGESLIKRGTINEFLVKRSSAIRALSRPRSTLRKGSGVLNYESRRIVSSSISPYAKSIAPPQVRRGTPTSVVYIGSKLRRDESSGGKTTPPAIAGLPEATGSLVSPTALNYRPSLQPHEASPPLDLSLPIASRVELSHTPARNFLAMPRPDPVLQAFRIIVGAKVERSGGLWLSGDVAEGMKRLDWIVGPRDADLISIDEEGRVQVDTVRLAEAAGVDATNPPGGAIIVADYISSNEGLLLLVQLTQGPHRYRLHIGEQAPTLGKEVRVTGSMNLDNNYDSRINPYRRFGKKLDHERPPESFDCLIAINPDARWLNLRTKRFVPVGHITFHELAEAYGKVELGLGYLGQHNRIGAHNLAIEREKMLESQRPFPDVVVTTGSNRVLRSQDEMRQIYVETTANTRR